MPLNFKENDEEQQDNNRDVGPILHQPAEASGSRTKLIAVIFLLIILLAGGFVVYKYVLKKGQQHQPKIETVTQGSDTAKSNVSQNTTGEQYTPPVSDQNNVQITSQPPTKDNTAVPDNSAKGNYTIYIARHKTQAVADEETGRWKNAGYETTISVIDGWYCVSVGRYETAAEAQDAAEKLSDGFEAGYKVGKVRE
jgi:cytoskeletal protein RodZ